MSYFAPYIDGTGIHMPTYEDRLEDLCEAYRSIFGLDAELSASVPDYQLLSVLAKALDDVSVLCLQAYNSRNPMYAAGNALDLLLPQYGISRQEGETDASVRARIVNALAGRNCGSADALLAAVRAANKVKEAKLYINETDTTDDKGIPGHSVAVVTRGGTAQAIAQAIWDKKAPGIGTWGSTSAEAVDSEGNPHTIGFSRYVDKIVFIYPFIRVLEGGDQERIGETVVHAIAEYVNELGIAVPLNIPQLYGVAYAADPEIANTFIITDMQVFAMGTGTIVRDAVPCAWNQKLTAIEDGGVSIRWEE